MSERPRRLVFGEVADLYDRSRPTYPDPLIDDLVAWAQVGRALEIGAGTGKATRLIGARGVPVLAIEPSAEMAAVARRACADLPQVEILESDFERWDPAGERFGLVFAGQAWHWVDPATGYRQARAALADGGHIAVFWNRAAWGPSALRDALAVAYREVAPEMDDRGPMHPANDERLDDEAWDPEAAQANRLADSEVRHYHWQIDYSPEQFAALQATLSETLLLDADTRERLLERIREVISEHGGTLRMPVVTRLRVARAV